MTENLWMIWRAGSGLPLHRHHSADAARQEAERLARLNPGATFYILKAVARCILPLPRVRWSHADEQESENTCAPQVLTPQEEILF